MCLFFGVDQYGFVQQCEQQKWCLGGDQWWIIVEIVYCQCGVVDDEIGEVECYVDDCVDQQLV